jgi:hypothetical protein
MKKRDQQRPGGFPLTKHILWIIAITAYGILAASVGIFCRLKLNPQIYLNQRAAKSLAVFVVFLTSMIFRWVRPQINRFGKTDSNEPKTPD